MKTIQTAAYEVSDLSEFPEIKRRVLEKRRHYKLLNYHETIRTPR